MSLTIQGDGDFFKLEQRDRGPATLVLKVAPTKDKAGNWKVTFLRLTVWPDREGETTAATALMLGERDKVTFTAKARTGTWEKDGKPQSALEWTLIKVALADRKPSDVVADLRAELAVIQQKLADAIKLAGESSQQQQPDDTDRIPF